VWRVSSRHTSEPPRRSAAQEIDGAKGDSARRLYFAMHPAIQLLLRHAQVPSERFDTAGNACGLQ